MMKVNFGNFDFIELYHRDFLLKFKGLNFRGISQTLLQSIINTHSAISFKNIQSAQSLGYTTFDETFKPLTTLFTNKHVTNMNSYWSDDSSIFTSGFSPLFILHSKTGTTPNIYTFALTPLTRITTRSIIRTHIILTFTIHTSSVGIRKINHPPI